MLEGFAYTERTTWCRWQIVDQHIYHKAPNNLYPVEIVQGNSGK